MSIYATLWSLQFPRYGDAYVGGEWIAVTAQGVPAHIGPLTPGFGDEDGDQLAIDALRGALLRPAESGVRARRLHEDAAAALSSGLLTAACCRITEPSWSFSLPRRTRYSRRA